MTDRELMQMALDALEYPGPSWPDARQKAAEALRAALAQPEQEPVRLQCVTCGTVYADGVPPQVAQPEQEPVAWGIANTRPTEKKPLMMVMLDEPEPSHLVIPLYTAPPQREVYCGCGDEIVAGDGARCGTCVAVKYKEKEWAGLTDAEILADDVLRYHFALNGGAGPISKKGMAVIAAVNAKLKEKNNG